MEQPRFGGVALPPLSHPCGEGKPCEIMESSNTEKSGLPQVRQEKPDSDIQKLMDVFHILRIPTHFEQHRLKHERQRNDSGSLEKGVYCKNLLLKDKKGQAYLIVCDENDTADLQVVKYHLNASGNLHFASQNALWNLLHVFPGSLTPLALIHPSGKDVRVLVDASLVTRIDRKLTKLYFHPLRSDLQVGLTLSQLEEFLTYCNIRLEMLPSLHSYGAGRHYGCKQITYRTRKHEIQEQISNEDLSVPRRKQTENESVPLDLLKEEPEKTMKHAETLETKYSELSKQFGINIEITTSKESMSASGESALPCRCVYLKDKRDNHFLFVCHVNQKIDFSNLKMQLKPKKKIMPLESEELWSLLHLNESRENPFSLADIQKPRFLVALADNLYHKEKTLITFPHPVDTSLNLCITLKDLDTFVRGTNHDMISIPVKGSIESLRYSPAPSACHTSASSATTVQKSKSEVTGSHAYSSSAEEVYPSSTNQASNQHGNLFFWATTALREHILRYIRWFVQFMDRHLPSQISDMLHRVSFWQRMITLETDCCTLDQLTHTTDPAKKLTDEREKAIKLGKLQELMTKSGISVEMKEIQLQTSCFLNDDVERSKTILLIDEFHRPYFIICSEEEELTGKILRRLHQAFRSHSSLSLGNDEHILQFLPWDEGINGLSWTHGDLNPLVVMDMDLQKFGAVQVGVTGTLYLFPDTMLSFDLATLGVTLHMTFDVLEQMLKQFGFSLVYLP